MVYVILLMIGKGLDILSTHLFTIKYGWQMEANPLAVYVYGFWGWEGIIFLTLLLCLFVYILDKIGGKYLFIKIFLWMFVMVNLLNPLRNFWIYFH